MWQITKNQARIRRKGVVEWAKMSSKIQNKQLIAKYLYYFKWWMFG